MEPIPSIRSIDESGSEIWHRVDHPNVIHRDDGPAITWDDGSRFWYYDGVNHNENGPSVIYANGQMHWHYHGSNWDFDRWCKTLQKTPEDIVFLKIKYGI